MWIRVNDQRMFVILLVALIALCWLTLTIWGLSPYADYLSHEILEDLPAVFNQEYIVLLLIFTVGWTLMIFAMMLPTSLPLIFMFQRLVHSRPNRLKLVGLLVSGYLTVWLLFGAGAHMVDLLIHDFVRHNGWLEANEWVISATIFAVAGLYQFTPLKYKCLEKCRSPLSFIVQHWRGSNEQRHAFQLGVHHGLFCLGCCWSLMLLMFAVSVGNLAWMLLLGMIMATEKNVPWGTRLSAPLGFTLLAFSVLVPLVELTSL
jgi:predicted metal-binding membrane protein